MNVKVIGAGSIGNHLANACVMQGLHVTIVDIDKEALNRTKNIIYPERYGKWNDNIILTQPDKLDGMQFDIIIIGTPPASHLSLAIEEIRNNPKAILIEKPLCGIADDEQIQLDIFKKLFFAQIVSKNGLVEFINFVFGYVQIFQFRHMRHFFNFDFGFGTKSTHF